MWLWALCCFGRAIKIEYIITFCYAKQTSLKLRIRHTLTHRETHNRNHYYQRGANIDKATDGASNVILCFSRYFFFFAVVFSRFTDCAIMLTSNSLYIVFCSSLVLWPTISVLCLLFSSFILLTYTHLHNTLQLSDKSAYTRDLYG